MHFCLTFSVSLYLAKRNAAYSAVVSSSVAAFCLLLFVHLSIIVGRSKLSRGNGFVTVSTVGPYTMWYLENCTVKWLSWHETSLAVEN